MEEVARGPVFVGEKDSPEGSAAFALCAVDRNRWYCAFRVAPCKAGNEQRTLLTWSDDAGQNWRTPFEPWPAMLLDGKPGQIRRADLTPLADGRLAAAMFWVDHSDPARPLFDPETEALLDSRILLSFSSDRGQTWTPPTEIDRSPFIVPVGITGPILPLPNGEWAISFELNKAIGDPNPWRHAAVMKFSPDEGKTWPRHTVAAQDPRGRIFYWDQRPALLPDGRMVDLFWVYDREAKEYLPMRGCESQDLGQTWSGMWDTGVHGQPGQPAVLPDGRMVMPYVDRTGPAVIRVRCSSDGGRTWPEATDLVLYASSESLKGQPGTSLDDAWDEMYQFACGLPCAAAIDERRVLVVYYAGPHPDHTGIHFVLVDAG